MGKRKTQSHESHAFSVFTKKIGTDLLVVAVVLQLVVSLTMFYRETPK